MVSGFQALSENRNGITDIDILSFANYNRCIWKRYRKDCTDEAGADDIQSDRRNAEGCRRHDGTMAR